MSHFTLLGKLFGFEIRRYSDEEWRKLQARAKEYGVVLGPQVKVTVDRRYPWDEKKVTQ